MSIGDRYVYQVRTRADARRVVRVTFHWGTAQCYLSANGDNYVVRKPCTAGERADAERGVYAIRLGAVERKEDDVDRFEFDPACVEIKWPEKAPEKPKPAAGLSLLILRGEIHRAKYLDPTLDVEPLLAASAAAMKSVGFTDEDIERNDVGDRELIATYPPKTWQEVADQNEAERLAKAEALENADYLAGRDGQ